MKPSSSLIYALNAEVSSHEIMERVSQSLSTLNFPFYLSDLMLFEELIDLYYGYTERMPPHLFFAMDHVISLIHDPNTPRGSRVLMARYFTQLTGASPNAIALSDIRATERYRHALSILLAVGGER